VSSSETCTRPPEGWVCNKPAGHEGPCPTYPKDYQRPRTILDRITSLVFQSRFLLIPFNFGLMLSLLVYSVRFVLSLLGYGALSLEAYKLTILGQIDVYMIANLCLMIIQGSFQIFIRKFPAHFADRGQWLDHIDTGLLKVKLSMSVASISLIQLLRDFVEDHDWVMTIHHAEIHGVFIASAVLMAAIWKITEHKDEHHVS
jgi:uncharacterized protein (TIGR00645 family)